MIGEKIRAARKAAGHSLAAVAWQAGISTATLSRLETGRQELDVTQLLTLAGVLGIDPAEMLGSPPDGNGREGSLAAQIGALESPERTILWRKLKTERRPDPRPDEIAGRIEELLAQVELVRSELDAVRVKLKKAR